MNERLDRIDANMGQLNDRFNDVDKKIDAQTLELKNFICSNNVAIVETLTLSLEDTHQRVSHNDELLTLVQKDTQTRIKFLKR